MAKTKTQNKDQLQTSNRALYCALRSAHKRGLLADEPTYQVARQVSIAASHYYKHFTGQMSEAECRTAIESCFSYQATDSAIF